MSVRHRASRTVGLVAGVLAFVAGTAPQGAAAAEGAIEISQTALDATGFPFVISAPGSYRLTSNLTVPNANTTAISITAGVNGVEIDLNGFTIAGPNTCSWDSDTLVVTCSANGSGDGIDGASATGVTVRNGNVKGMGNDGIVLGARSRVENLIVSDVGDDGIRVGDHSIATHTILYQTVAEGLQMGNVAVSTDNLFVRAGGHALLTGSRAALSENYVFHAVGSGIRAGGLSSIRSNVAVDASEGIYAGGASSVTRNIAYSTRTVGISSGSSLFRENVATEGAGVGLSIGSDSNVVRNVSVGNVGEDIERTVLLNSDLLVENLIDDGSMVGGTVDPSGNCCAGVSQYEFPQACNPVP